jgi:transcriptional regulator with XRE-family HTH domain
MTSNNEKSLIEEYEETDRGAQGLAAAGLARQVIELLHEALDASGLDQKDLASRVDVTEGRISQVLNGDGNLRIAALARYLRAMGYNTTVSAEPVDRGGPSLSGQGQARGEAAQEHSKLPDWDVTGFSGIFEQSAGYFIVGGLAWNEERPFNVSPGGPVIFHLKRQVSDSRLDEQVDSRFDCWA